jgi:glycerophosphoryl diester phosphodiesterase
MRYELAGVKVLPWTVNSSADWEKMIAISVDGLISDQPKELIEYLKSKGLR